MNSTLSITIRVAAAQAQAALSQVQGQITQVQKSVASAGAGSGGGLDSFTKSAKMAGYTLTTAFSLPLIAAGKSLTSFVLDNEAATADLVKVYGSGLGPVTVQQQQDLVKLGQEFKLLSDYYGVNQTEVIQVAAAWAQAGVQGNALGESVTNTMKAMVIGDLNSTDATKDLIAIQAQYHASSKDLTNILNDLNVVENQTAVGMGDLITGFTRSAGAAAASGVDYAHLAALIAALVPASGSAASAGNSLKTIFSNLLAPTTKAAGVLKDLGFNINSAGWQSENADQKLESLAKQFVNLTGTQKAAVSSTIATRYQVNRFDILLQDIANSSRLGGKGLSYYGIALDATTNKTTGLVNTTANAKVAMYELQTVLDSNPKKLAEVGNIMKNSLGDVMVDLIPLIVQLAGTLAVAAQWFSNLNPYIQKATGYFLLFLAAVGPIAFYLGAFATIFSFLASGFKLLLAPLGLVTKAFGIFGGEAAATTAAATEIESSNLVIGRSYQGMAATINESILLVVVTLEDLISYIIEMPAITGTSITEVTNIFNAGGASWAAATETAGATITTTVATIMETAVGLVAAGWSEIEAATTGAMAVWTAEVDTGLAAIEGTIAASGEVIDMVWVESLGVWMAEWEAALLETEAAVAAAMATIEEEVAAGAETVVAETAGILGGLGEAVLGALGAIAGILLSPWTLAVAAVLGVLYAFRKQVVQVWDAIVGDVQTVFNALPAAIQNPLKAVVNIVYQAAMAVYDLFSYLNPFAHHSPSLVENVTNGMAIVMQQFQQLGSLAAPINTAYNLIQKFGSAISGLVASGNAADRAADLANLTKFDPAAIPLYNQLTAILDQLTVKETNLSNAVRIQQGIVDSYQASLDAANTNLTNQQSILTSLTATQQKYSDLMSTAKDNIQNYANTQITGQQAMSDAIFGNTQAQKQLQLQMLQMQDVTGPIDDVTSKLAALQGQIEELSGQQKALRQGGAGSEITGGIQSQITQLTAQQVATQQSAAAYNDLSDQLTKLQNQGQELDLENSLDFDGLTRQIQEAANAMTELPFDQIMKGIQDNQANLKIYTDQYDKATAAVNKQTDAVTSATAARDAIQKSYDAENTKLQALQKGYQDVSTAIGDVNTALQQMQNASQSVTGKAAKAAGAGGLPPANGDFANAGLGGNLAGGASTSLDDQIAALQKQLQDKMKGLNLLDPIKQKISEVVGWIEDHFGSSFWGKIADAAKTGANKIHLNLGGLTSGLNVSGFASALESIGKFLLQVAIGVGKVLAPTVVGILKDFVAGFDNLSKNVLPRVVPLLNSIVNLFTGLWNVIKPIGEVALVILLAALKILGPIIVGVLGPALQTIGNVVGDMMDTLTAFLNFIGDVFHGRWGKAWDDIKAIVGSIFKAMEDIALGAIKIFLGIITGLAKGLVSVFGGMWNDALNITEKGISAVGNWFAKLPGVILGYLKDAGKWLLQVGIDILTGLLNGIVTGGIAYLKFWADLPGVLLGFFVKANIWLIEAGLNILTGLINGITTGAVALWNWYTALPATLVGFFKAARTWLGTSGAAIANGIVDGIKTGAVALWNWLLALPATLVTYFKKAGTWLVSVGGDVAGGLVTGVRTAVSGISGFITGLPGTIVGLFNSTAHGPLNWLKGIGGDIASGLWNGLKAGFSTTGSLVSELAGDVWSGFEGLMNRNVIAPLRSFGFTMPKLLGGASIHPFSGIQPLATGGIFDKSTLAVIGEAGKEVAIPLTNPMRAWQLVQQSGLLNVIAPMMNASTSLGNLPGTINRAMNRNANANISSGNVLNNDNSTTKTMHFHGDLSFPNIKSSNDVEKFLSSLEGLSKK